MENTTAAAPESAGAVLPSPPKSAFTVVQQPILEGGRYYLKNQQVLLTADRAKALGEQVKPFPPPAPVAKAAPASSQAPATAVSKPEAKK